MAGSIQLYVRGKYRNGEFHQTGGGFVEDTVPLISLTTYIGPVAKVLDTAIVGPNCIIDGQAIIMNTATITFSTINDHTVVKDNAKVSGAIIGGYSVVDGDSEINGGVLKDLSRMRAKGKNSGQNLSGYESRPYDYVEGNNPIKDW